MTKRILVLCVLLLVAMPILSQDGQSKKTTTCAGAISDDGQTFTCEKDHHVWKASNPGAFRDLEGRKAKVTFRRASAADEIFVTSAALIPQQTVAANPGDSAFRR